MRIVNLYYILLLIILNFNSIIINLKVLFSVFMCFVRRTNQRTTFYVHKAHF